MIKKLFCLLLTLCTLFCFSACQKEEPEQPDDGFPTTAETIYPVVEGDRIPFQVLCTAFVDHDMVFRTADEAHKALMRSANSWGFDDTERAQLAAINYEKYQVLCVTIQTFDDELQKGVRELVIQDGALKAVYCSGYVKKTEDWSGSINAALPGSYMTVLLIRKSDFDFSAYEHYNDVEITNLICYQNYPDRVDSYKYVNEQYGIFGEMTNPDIS